MLEKGLGLKEHKTYYKEIFYGIMVAGIVAFFVILIASVGSAQHMVLSPADKDTFGDFLTPLINNVIDSPYRDGAAYPALSNVVFNFFAEMTNVRTLRGLAAAPQMIDLTMVRTFQQYLIPWMMYFVMTSTATAFAVFYYKKGSLREKWMFVFIVFLSSPFLFLLERANIVILTLFFVLLFFILYESGNKKAKEFGLVSLGLASGLSFFPILFILILLREQKWKESGRALLYSAICFFVPFALFGGLDGIALFFGGLMPSSGIHDIEVFQVQFSNLFAFLGKTFGWYEGNTAVLSNIFITFTAIAGILGIFFLREKWKAVLLAVCLFIGISADSPVFMLSFLILPVIQFLNDNEKRCVINYIYLVLFAVVLIPKAFGPLHGGAYYAVNLSVSTIIDMVSLTLLTALASVEGLIAFVRRVCSKRGEVTPETMAASV